ncbi:phosphate ABC transporter permease PstA [Saccharomonospora sp. NPDC046836]|uniref:phosphate ABC transporter permease PstA n=1 Tax=Saccharomonospora sp. NPDC046836 TaxID=3156921 RepID=UPI0033E12BDF
MTLPADHEVRRDTRALHVQDVITLVGAAVAAVAVTGWVSGRILPISGAIAFVAIAFPVFLAFTALLTWVGHDGLTVRDRLAAVLAHGVAAVALIALVCIVAFPLVQGIDALVHVNFFTQDMSNAGTLDPLTLGGILHAIVGTLQQITIALVITVPLGLACAVFLNETRGAFTRFVRTIVEAMTALPSIVAGLFVYASLIIGLGIERSGFAAGCAISVMMLPITVRAADVVIRLVPGSLREASLALGAPQWRTVWHVVLPTARSGLTTAVLLGTARGVGETSPVLITAGFTPFLNFNPFVDSQVSLPLATFTLVTSSEETMKARGYGAAAVLMALVLGLFVLARAISGREPGRRRR